jgi:hypothetical protein
MLELERLLREAAAAHHVYEVSTGIEDPDWPKWYARFIAPKLGLPIALDYQPCEGTYGKA